MPEIGEIARIVHFLKKHVVGNTISAVKTQEDDIVYGKVGCSATAFSEAMTGKKVLDARQQGKYFWLVMSSPPHPLMHFGMTGWIKFSNDDNAHYRSNGVVKPGDAEWPPRFWKFILQIKEEPDCEVAFVDGRRLGRIRLVDVEGDMMRKTTPLKENGPDPVVDSDILTQEWLAKKLRSKKVPVKALLLDQANISGVGNWVGDEVLYQAKLHPEQYSNTFSDEQIQRLHDSLIDVCTTACTTLADSEKFPENWLMRHRWNKGKEGGDRLPNGEKIIFLKVGGRTSAVIPSVQKKTGPVSAGIKGEGDEDEDGAEEKKPKKAKGRGKAVDDDVSPKAPTAKRARKTKQPEPETEASDEEEEDEVKPNKKLKLASNGTGKKTAKGNTSTKIKEETPGKRRSTRN
ncbi:uncharacterized protein BDZ99DRAFT_438256 [Mytilinidion resinicola]|uniref:Formamidopyrimidine-DNA glycosylase catalytic domain-containing protein n=1 Tax=Mytilinidion resinicola TaxID=574789 RepID=A0A6A6YZ63_9PEZI|nr:uncharacterized protein BDZ99DRAFT_438256 [Mytilinidion resinicola]KAF2813247.1 hypothetical protein BDZ99DRAFT_438256 [Mytilinidion resinicola]